MRTAKNRNIKNKTIKGGRIPNTKVHLIVRKSNIDQSNEKLIYDLIIAKPAFPFITDYMWNSMNSVDEALALMRMKEIPVKPEIGTVNEPESDVLYKDEFEYGYNKIDDDDDDDVAPKKPAVAPKKLAAASSKPVPPISATATPKPLIPPTPINEVARKLSDASSKAARQIVGDMTRLRHKRNNQMSGNDSPRSSIKTNKKKEKQRSAKQREAAQNEDNE